MKIRTRLQVAAALIALAAQAFAASPICDGTTALTLIGMDTAAGRTLFGSDVDQAVKKSSGRDDDRCAFEYSVVL